MIKKKGRKPKLYYQNLDNSNNIIVNDFSKNNLDLNLNDTLEKEVKIPKKRGRKPKGGIVVEEKKLNDNYIPIPNIILHLKCKINELYDKNDIKYNPNIEKIDTYNIQEKHSLNFNFIKLDEIKNKNSKNENVGKNLDLDIDLNFDGSFDKNPNLNENLNLNDNLNINENPNINENININDNLNMNENPDVKNKKKSNIEYEKIISKKLKELSYNLKSNNIDNKSDCFWCTYSYDNETIVIPKYELNNVFYCYGSFCSPECACSYLMNDPQIDTSTKFERYYLLNNIYGKIYDYNKNIKPAPSPHYLLKKFNGTLDIQEYRQLLKNERFLLVVDKPLTKIFPELYEENDDFFVNCKTITKNNLKLKRNN